MPVARKELSCLALRCWKSGRSLASSATFLATPPRHHHRRVAPSGLSSDTPCNRSPTPTRGFVLAIARTQSQQLDSCPSYSWPGSVLSFLLGLALSIYFGDKLYFFAICERMPVSLSF